MIFSGSNRKPRLKINLKYTENLSQYALTGKILTCFQSKLIREKFLITLFHGVTNYQYNMFSLPDRKQCVLRSWMHENTFPNSSNGIR